ncbi:uncharacterized protein [Rhodnius prolixus]|uniref:uncharacterized protein n=1 Tax=Rhodnius prolixus TaxID=13249 RepID=UPI003D187A62
MSLTIVLGNAGRLFTKTIQVIILCQSLKRVSFLLVLPHHKLYFLVLEDALLPTLNEISDNTTQYCDDTDAIIQTNPTNIIIPDADTAETLLLDSDSSVLRNKDVNSTFPELSKNESKAASVNNVLSLYVPGASSPSFDNEENEDPFHNSDESDKDPNYLHSGSNSSDECECEVIENSEIETEQQLDGETAKRTKKRKRNKSMWKKNAAKIARNSGNQYVSSSKSKKIIAAREIKPPCKDTCKLKCNTKINDESRIEIFKSYWALGSTQRQRDYLASCMTPIQPKYQYHRHQSKRRDNTAFHFNMDGIHIRVCKSFFRSTLDITDRPIRTVISKRDQVGGMIAPDFRGKHEKHHRLDANIKEGIRRHINSIPRIESHYTRARSSREFIEGGKSLRDLHRDYVKECTENNLPYGKYLIYHQVFTREFNISFFTPKKDQCGICATYTNSGEEEKQNLKDEYEIHISEKELSRLEKQSDKEKISKNHVMACFDLQAVMPCPKGDTSSFYYKTKLNVLNFTVYEINQNNKGDQCYCYIWDETQGHRGANEIGSCLLNYIEERSKSVPEEDIDFVLYSDNCVGQQKNRFILSMYIYALLKYPNVKSITHKFLIVGHTQNEGDNAHSLIERQIKRSLKSGPIFLPAEYVGVIKSAKKTGNPFLVKELSFTDFFDLKRLNEIVGNMETTKTNDDKLNCMKVIKIERESPFTILYKTSYAEDNFSELKIKRPTRRLSSINNNNFSLDSLYKNKIKICDKKKKGLLELVNKKHIPVCHAEFYKNL